MQKIILSIIILTVLNIQVAFAQAGSLDVDFGISGKVVTNLGSVYDYGRAVTIKTDGKIIVGGTSKVAGSKDFALTQYNTDGTLDITFGQNGLATVDFNTSIDNFNSLALQSDGKIVSAGTGGSATFDFALTRHNTDGSLDSIFGQNGRIITDIDTTLEYTGSLVIQPDDKILVVGGADYSGYATDEDSDFAMVRYNSNGSLDSSFGVNGKVMTDFSNNSMDAAKSVELQTDGKIIAAGYAMGPQGNEFALVRLNNDGTIDNSFGTSGRVLISFNSTQNIANPVAVDTNEKIIVAGYSAQGNNSFSMARLNVDGSLDSLFGTDGKVITHFNSISACSDISIQNDGKIILTGMEMSGAGDTINFALARYFSENDVLTEPSHHAAYRPALRGSPNIRKPILKPYRWIKLDRKSLIVFMLYILFLLVAYNFRHNPIIDR